MKRQFFITTILACSIYSEAQAQNQMYPVVTGANLLTIPTNAKYSSMAETGSAISSGNENDINWNVAKLVKVEADYNLSANYIKWGTGSSMVGDVSFASKVNTKGVLGVNVKYFTLGETVYKDVQGGIMGSFKPHEYAFTIAYAFSLSKYISVGASLKGISSSMYNTSLAEYNSYKNAYAFAGDIGLYYQSFNEESYSPIGLSAGITLQNMGSKIKYSDIAETYLPTNLKLGVGLNLIIDEQSTFDIGLDLNKLLVPSQGPQYSSSKNVINGMLSSFGDAPGGISEEIKEVRWSIGAEYTYKNRFFARAGYTREAWEKGNRTYAAAGAGLKYYLNEIPIKIDFAYFVPTQSNSPYFNNFAVTAGIGFFKQQNKKHKSAPHKKKEEKSDQSKKEETGVPVDKKSN